MRQVFSAFPASDAFDSIILARLTYARALPRLHRRTVLCSFVLHLLLKRAADDATRFFQSCPVPKALSFLVAGVTYL